MKVTFWVSRSAYRLNMAATLVSILRMVFVDHVTRHVRSVWPPARNVWAATTEHSWQSRIRVRRTARLATIRIKESVGNVWIPVPVVRLLISVYPVRTLIFWTGISVCWHVRSDSSEKMVTVRNVQQIAGVVSITHAALSANISFFGMKMGYVWRSANQANTKLRSCVESVTPNANCALQRMSAVGADNHFYCLQGSAGLNVCQARS